MYILEYLNFIEFEKRYSKHTVIAYNKDIIQFQNFLKAEFGNEKVITVSFREIRSFIVFLIDQEQDTRTVNRKISCLKTYFKFLQRNNWIGFNPMLKVIPPKTSKKIPVFLEEEKMTTLLDGDYFNNDFVGKRNRLIFELFYATGIRLSELVSLKRKDVDLYNEQLKVTGKGNKQRIIPFATHLSKIFNEYFEEANKSHLSLDGEVFVTETGNKIYSKLVYRIVNDYLSKVTAKEKKSPHVLRHSFATHLLNNGADLNAIKEILGHTSLAATQVYTHNSIEKLKNIYKQAHPRA